MKEYKYIIEAMDGYLASRLASLICLENYEVKTYPDGYRRIFDEYIKLRTDYKNGDIETHEEWQAKSLKDLNDFVGDISNTVNKEKITHLRDEYICKLEDEEYRSLGKEIAIYPYLIKEARKMI